MVSRRSLLGGLLAVLSASAIPRSAGAGAPESEERRALLAHLRERSVGFDLLDLARRGLEQVGLKRWIPEVEALLEGREHQRGLRSLHDLAKDASFRARASALMERASKDLRTKLVIRRLARTAPQTEAEQRAFIEWVYTEWFGLEMQRVREHVAAYPEGLLVVVGPPTNLAEVVYSAGREPFLRFLELVHGYRATEWVAHVHPQRQLLESLFDPAVRVVAFVGHGSWTAFSLRGVGGDPSAHFATLCRKLRQQPRKYVPLALSNNPWRTLGAPYTGTELREEDLRQLAEQLHPAGGPPLQPKELVVRYTCGVERYATDARLLWQMLPEELGDKIGLRDGTLSAAWPEDEGAWEAPLEAWLQGRSVEITDQPALGTCLVARPEDTRGYAGNSWLPDFMEDPIPAYQPAYAWRLGLPVEGDAPADAPVSAPSAANPLP